MIQMMKNRFLRRREGWGWSLDMPIPSWTYGTSAATVCFSSATRGGTLSGKGIGVITPHCGPLISRKRWILLPLMMVLSGWLLRISHGSLVKSGCVLLFRLLGIL
eukprot:Lithocolla_globosa_v1_NODE_2673_length_1910_cov_6.773585.p2 type:complete len:105 gc:universal NODE_2673_length_1910_cov_6.773585:1602-1288(-)